MKHTLQILVLTLIFSSLVLPQIKKDSVTISDRLSHEKTLVFGFDMAATDGIDPQFGESLLPPFPPPGAFDARFFLPENGFSGTAASWRDFRNIPDLPFAGTKEFRLAYQGGSGSPGIRISWNFPSTINNYVFGYLQDLFGGVLINVYMIDSGFFNVTPPLDRLKMIITYEFSPVPVELISFKASLMDNSVLLNWQTASEVNNRGFEIERNSPGSNWENIGFVEGAGNSTSLVSYSYTDENKTTGTYKYRLKQIDFDGTYKYSNEIEVGVDLSPTEFVLHQNYPNPFNPTTKIKYSIPNVETHRDASLHAVSLKVFDILGNEITTLINETKSPGTYEVEFDASDLPSGVYLYKLSSGNYLSIKKMMLVK